MEVALVYPHQLFLPHPALAEGRMVRLVEDPLFFGNDPHWPMAMHRQKLVLHRASMSAYAEELKAADHKVQRIDLPDGNTLDSAALLDCELPKSLKTLHVADPADDVLSRRLQRLARKRGIELVVHPTPNFMSPPSFLEKHLAGRTRPFMAKFYEAQRKRMKLLLDEHGGPLGGHWSYDVENRKKLPKHYSPPRPPEAASSEHLEEAIAWVTQRFPDRPGSLDTFRWAHTRAQAEAWLEQFARERLADFGDYEDAISTAEAFLHHSALTPMLNIGLLDPEALVRRIVRYGQRSSKVPLNSLEGFVRQVIGWREFMHGIYIHRSVEVRNANFWNFDRALPAAFYDGTTGIPPVDRVIRQLLAEGWCHHIERLMILGNFMLLCRIRPHDVYRWFMEMFVDSYDWVMVPNVYGMSQFADGGTFTTKPYLSGSNYVLKMSDEPKGEWCEIWDGLFWIFIADHRDFFMANPRLSMMARTEEKQPPEKKAAHRRAANAFLKRLDEAGR